MTHKAVVHRKRKTDRVGIGESADRLAAKKFKQTTYHEAAAKPSA